MLWSRELCRVPILGCSFQYFPAIPALAAVSERALIPKCALQHLRHCWWQWNICNGFEICLLAARWSPANGYRHWWSTLIPQIVAWLQLWSWVLRSVVHLLSNSCGQALVWAQPWALFTFHITKPKRRPSLTSESSSAGLLCLLAKNNPCKDCFVTWTDRQEQCLLYRAGNSGRVWKRYLACCSTGSSGQSQKLGSEIPLQGSCCLDPLLLEAVKWVLVICSWAVPWLWFTAPLWRCGNCQRDCSACDGTCRFQWLLVLFFVGLFYFAVKLQGHFVQEKGGGVPGR